MIIILISLVLHLLALLFAAGTGVAFGEDQSDRAQWAGFIMSMLCFSCAFILQVAS